MYGYRKIIVKVNLKDSKPKDNRISVNLRYSFPSFLYYWFYTKARGAVVLEVELYILTFRYGRTL